MGDGCNADDVKSLAGGDIVTGACCRRNLSMVFATIIGCSVGSTSGMAQQACTTTLECAQAAEQAAAQAVSAVQALRDRVDALEKELKVFDRFVTVQTSLIPQHAEAVCPPNSRIISAACVGNNGTPQAAVGPQFDFNGTGKAMCDRFGNVVMPVQATAIYLKTN
jgi:hypothetical protein